MKRFSLRIGNIEIRETADARFHEYEVVKWSPNPLYGKKDEYRVETPLGEIAFKKGCVNYSESCFDHPETCYVVSFITWNHKEPCWDVDEVGTRPWQLEDEDYDNWSKVMKLAFTQDILPKPDDDEEDN